MSNTSVLTCVYDTLSECRELDQKPVELVPSEREGVEGGKLCKEYDMASGVWSLEVKGVG